MNKKQYQREWKRKWRETHRKEYNAYMREWRRKNPKKAKAIDLKRGQKHRNSAKNRYWIRRKEIYQLLSNKCVICGRSFEETILCFHEVHGKKHPRSEKKFLEYILNHLEDFALMCRRCHGVLHAYSKFKEKINELERKLD